MIHTFVKGEPNWVDPLNANFQEVASTAGSAIPASEKGAAGGVATLDGGGKLVQMPTAEDVGAMAADAIQSGSNSNDSYIKWPDGTMECWGQVSGTSDSSGYLTVTFPVAFATTPAAFLVSGVSGSGIVERGSLTATQGKVGFRSYINGDFLANQASRAAAWHAIGRWK